MDQLLKDKRILVVEDEETNWFLLRDILTGFSAQVVWAEIGQKAIDLIENGEKFDLILMDIHLPSMDGLEVTEKIKAIHPEIPVIAQTAFALDEEIRNIYDAGCDGHVLKPFSIPELSAAIKKILQP
ncbi:MAG: response regulator [Bacteroidales bacterium]|jgi:CheY-like chemotaxis protein